MPCISLSKDLSPILRFYINKIELIQIHTYHSCLQYPLYKLRHKNNLNLTILLLPMPSHSCDKPSLVTFKIKGLNFEKRWQSVKEVNKKSNWNLRKRKKENVIENITKEILTENLVNVIKKSAYPSSVSSRPDRCM